MLYEDVYMFDWTAHTKDPTDTATSMKFHDFLQSLLRFYHTNRTEFLKNYVKDKRLLDIGAGEHDIAFYSEDKWEHGQLCKVASYAMAAEIHQELCDHYNAKGFNFTCVDATSGKDLGERFERVFIGDVIEHVDNPILLLQFASRHLQDSSGRILVSTPNPFALSWLFARFKKSFFRPFYIANFEHMSWISPTNANEIARRAGLDLVAIYMPKPTLAHARKFKDYSKVVTNGLLEKLGMLELAHKEYIYEFAPRD